MKSLQGLACDSRLVKAGDTFFAFAGSKANGLQFIPEAIQKGAVAVVVEQGAALPKISVPMIEVKNVRRAFAEAAAAFYGYPSRHLKVIAMTGTNGKTSICYLTAQALRAFGKKVAILSTLGNGMLDHLQASELTTVDALQIQASLAEFLKAGIEYVVMEASSHGLDQERLAGTEVKIGVFTNLTRDHLDYHENMAAYAAAKQRLFQDFPLEAAVINEDDELGRCLIQNLKARKLPVYTYGLGSSADLHAENILLQVDGMQGRISTPAGSAYFQSRLVGQFNVYNILAIVGVLLSLKFPLAEIINTLGILAPVPGRLNSVVLAKGTKVFLDFAHTPDALAQALGSLRSFAQAKLICVFGCGGDRDRGKRPLMAEISERFADISVVTDDNPRFEDSAAIIAEVLMGFSQNATVLVEADRKLAIEKAVAIAGENDIILLAGKGGEPYQVIGSQKIPFSELEILAPYVQTVV